MNFHIRPAGYLGDYFKNYFEKEYYEILGTTNLPGDPRPQEGAYPYCDEYCKTQKDHEGQLPCKYETSEGYCKDPDKKKPRFKYDIEHSDRGLDEPVDDESETSRQEGLAKPYSDIRSIVTTLLEGPGFENEELELFRMYFTDELTQEDIAKKLKISQSVVSERIKKLEKKIKKAIEDHLPVNFNY
jgi:RNA polymerase sigma factor (sigma-70 family)